MLLSVSCFASAKKAQQVADLVVCSEDGYYEGGYSLWSWHAEWKGPQLFLLVTTDESGGLHDYDSCG